MNFFYKSIKRIIDILISLSVLILSSPILLLTYFIVKKTMGTPVFFKQLRPGLNCKPFYLYKFRSMTDQRDSEGNLLADNLRMTKFGKFMRSTSIDELPQMLNVLKGDMSIVGPRPLLMEYIACYTPEQLKRQNVMPGITGWSQVNGRSSIKLSKKLELDAYYADHASLSLDFKIIALTFYKVLSRKDNAEGVDFDKIDDINLYERAMQLSKKNQNKKSS